MAVAVAAAAAAAAAAAVAVAVAVAVAGRWWRWRGRYQPARHGQRGFAAAWLGPKGAQPQRPVRHLLLGAAGSAVSCASGAVQCRV
jgi:hypothetical protein